MILVAPDSFKGTYSSQEVASAIAGGLREAGIAAECCSFADGGEGTLDVVLAALGGRCTTVGVHDPLGRPHDARLGMIADGEFALVEMAQASGLDLVARGERDAEAASTYGTGELVAAAVARGARRVVLAAGGSATTDGGAGAIDAIRAAGGLRGATLEILCDVRSPFELAAVRYAAQKGADRAAVIRLTERLESFALTLPHNPRGRPMGGAAGGLAGGLWATFDARLRSGATWMLETLAFTQRLARADAVVVGEGSLDDQSFDGKAVGIIAGAARAARVPVHAVVGRSHIHASTASRLGLISIRTASTLAAMHLAGIELAHTVYSPTQEECRT